MLNAKQKLVLTSLREACDLAIDKALEHDDDVTTNKDVAYILYAVEQACSYVLSEPEDEE